MLFTSRAPIGYCTIAANEITTNQGFKSLILRDGLVPEFVRHYLLASKEYAESLASGTTFLELSGARMAELEIPVAPSGEQRRIVARIDALQARSRAAREALADVPALLDLFRQSVLAAAFRGDLTAEWRAKNTGVEPASKLLERIRAERKRRWELANPKKKYVEPDRKDEDEELLPAVPDSWAWASIDEVGAVLLGRQRAPQYLTGRMNRPYLRVANIKDDRISFDDVEEMDFDEEHREKYRLAPGDILLSEGQSLHLVGQSAIYRGGHDGLCFQKTLHRFRPLTPGPTAEFAQLVFRTWVKSGVFRRRASITTNIAHLTLERLKCCPFPLPPDPEQREIIRVATMLLRRAEAVAHAFSSMGADLDTLDQSILARAFRGELVDQDPNDEPASALLSRLKHAVRPHR